MRDRIAAVAEEILQDGPMNRHAFVAALVERGIELSVSGQEPVHIMMFLSTLGLMCHADGDRFALVSQWLPGAAEPVRVATRRWPSSPGGTSARTRRQPVPTSPRGPACRRDGRSS